MFVGVFSCRLCYESGLDPARGFYSLTCVLGLADGGFIPYVLRVKCVSRCVGHSGGDVKSVHRAMLKRITSCI